MILYIDLYFLLNFTVDALILSVCRRALGYRRRLWRILLGALAGALYSVFTLFVTLPCSILFHLAFGVLMLLLCLGYGNLRRFLRLCMLFFGVSFLLGGAIGALSRGLASLRNGGGRLGVMAILLLALPVALLCLFLSSAPKGSGKTATVTLSGKRGQLSFSGYVDSGNRAREPLENIPVVMANAALSRKVFALLSSEPLPHDCHAHADCFRRLPLRLIPVETVAGKRVLAALKFEDAILDGVKMPLCVALDTKRKGDYCGFDALIPDGVV